MKLKTYKSLAGSASVVALTAAGALLLSSQIALAEVCALYVTPNTVSDGGAVGTGASSLACGTGAEASANQTTAVGVSAIASGAGGTALGFSTDATGTLATAIGFQS